ncbi:MAG: permease [Treponemataceae bacterium]|nr:permease [Treponemataceae bacterium]
MTDILQRELIYLWYYFDLQLRQIFWYWVLGIAIGSCISVFAKKSIHRAAEVLGRRVPGIAGIAIASALGIASPLCMYGTVPICAAFSRKGVKDDFLAAFMMASVLLNPQLILYSAALGPAMLAVRIASCFLCGVCAGILVRVFFCRKGGRPFFDFSQFAEPSDRDTEPNIALRLLKNIARNIRATGPMFLLGIALSAVFQRYVPADAMARLFGKNEGFGVLMAATIGVPLYVCGGGTIPLLQQWLASGMSAGSAAAFMLTGPATKITNLGALKTALGARNFALYLVFVIAFPLAAGLLVNAVL